MKICVISSTVFPVPVIGYSGLEHLAWQQAKGLAERDHQVTLIAPDNSHCPNVRVIPTGPPGQHSEEQAYQKYWQFLPYFDATIDHSWQKWSYILKQEGRLKSPVLGVCHAPVNTMLQSLPPIEKPCFVGISQDMADHFKGLFSKEMKVAYNGIDSHDFYKPLGIPRSDRFLFLARFSTVKSPDVCVEVCKRAGKCLDLVGDTKLTGESEFLQSILGTADGKDIRFVGPATRGETVWFFSQSRGFLHLNNRFREPFGLAPVEAQACGNSVLCWNLGAMRETVKHGETGFLVNSVDDAVDVLKSDILDTLDRGRCREWASQFSVDRMISRYEELCEEAIEGGW